MERAAREAGVYAVVLCAATLLAYLPALQGGFIWDDDFYVTANDTLTDGSGLARIWFDPGANPQFYPLTFTSFWIERRLFGLDPHGYHLVNVLLHAGSAFLLWRILRLLEIPGAAFAASLFALHPLEVESVAWITERKNVLSGVFFFAAALSYLRFAVDPKRTRRFPALALTLFACALLSKSVTAFLPLVLALVLVWKRGRLSRRDLLPLSLMLLLGVASGLLTAHLERAQVGAVGEEWSMTLLERFLLAGRIFWFYLQKLLLPRDLAFVYPRFRVDATALSAWLYPLAALALAGTLFAFRRRLGRAPLLALACYTLLLLPVLGFLNVFPMRYSFVADHFQYLAGVGPLVLFAAFAARVVQGRKLAHAAALLLLGLLGASTFGHARVFHDPETLWRDTVSKYPAAFMAQYNLACLLDEQGKKQEAVAHLQQAIEANPGYVDALNNLGAIRLDEGKVEEAASCFERIVAAAPQHLTARFNLALALDRLGKTERAIAELAALIRAVPDPGSMPDAMTALLYRRGWLGIPLDRAHVALASMLARVGRVEEAAGHYRAAAALRPDLAGPWLSLGRLYLEHGDAGRAAQSFERAVQIEPGDASARLLLGRALERTGLRERASAAYREALRIAPDLVEARERLTALAAPTSPTRTP